MMTFAAIADRLASMSTLGQAWDGYDASPPTSDAVKRAGEFLVRCDVAGVRPTRLAPSVVGGIGITFRSADHNTVYVEFYNDLDDPYTLRSDDVSEPTSTRGEPSVCELIAFMAG